MFKQYFFISMLSMIPAGIILYFLIQLGKTLLGMVSDRSLNKELDELVAHGDARRQARVETNEKRLDNGCEHEFDGALGGFPPEVCHKCGLASEKPNGPCDHVWRAGEGGAPHSACEKCGRSYNPSNERRALA
ncbi:MAG: hypothetical protein H8E66_05075 [Planctomycetes bacterium]|nr:hypothetical protein [Planctomycetota bacterium]